MIHVIDPVNRGLVPDRSVSWAGSENACPTSHHIRLWLSGSTQPWHFKRRCRRVVSLATPLIKPYGTTFATVLHRDAHMVRFVRANTLVSDVRNQSPKRRVLDEFKGCDESLAPQSWSHTRNAPPLPFCLLYSTHSRSPSPRS